MENFVFHVPCKIIFGRDTVGQVGAEAAAYGKRVLLVTGGSSVHQSGLYEKVLTSLCAAELSIFDIGSIQPNPRLTSVYEGITICKRERVEIVLAVGGGSVIDAAKAMAAGALYDGDVWDFFSGKAKLQQALPVGTILTLAATGSEMNKNSVITNWETHEKVGYGNELLIPRFSILDPTLTFSVPPDQTANGIVDIMVHVMEQYFSPTPDTAVQDRLAEGILQTMIEAGPAAIAEPENYGARANIMWCGTLALNSLLSRGKTCDWASHGIEHQVSAVYDIPHGAGLAILYPHWMEYVLAAGVEKFKQLAVRVWGVTTNGRPDREVALEGIRRTREFFDSIGAPSTFGHYRIGPENIPFMAAKAIENGPLGKFKPLQQADVEAILRVSL
jgi:alcohol dehydrogenase YqhD (iron-dependent ADH family)